MPEVEIPNVGELRQEEGEGQKADCCTGVARAMENVRHWGKR